MAYTQPSAPFEKKGKIRKTTKGKGRNLEQLKKALE